MTLEWRKVMNGALFRFWVLFAMCKVHLYINVYLVTFYSLKWNFCLCIFRPKCSVNRNHSLENIRQYGGKKLFTCIYLLSTCTRMPMGWLNQKRGSECFSCPTLTTKTSPRLVLLDWYEGGRVSFSCQDFQPE